MKLAKIKDGYLFKTDNENGTHTYAVYYDRGKKEYRAIPTTHLYREDPNRMKEKKAGSLMQVKFPSIFLPSGVKDYYHTTDVNGNKINVKSDSVKFISKNTYLKNYLIALSIMHVGGIPEVLSAEKSNPLGQPNCFPRGEKNMVTIFPKIYFVLIV